MSIQMEALTEQITTKGSRRVSGPRGVEGEKGYIPGSLFDVDTEEEAQALARLGLAKRLSAPAPADGEAETEEPAVDAPWTLGVPPDQYLAKWPQGPNAAQARAILEKKAAADKAAELAKIEAGKQQTSGPRPI